MDVLLGKLTSQAMSYAIRSGITITTTYAIGQCSRLLKQTPHSHQHRQELLELQIRLDSKIRIISPAIDMIELISARGNTTLENAVSLTKGIRFDIQRLGTRVAGAVAEKKPRRDADLEIMAIISLIRLLLLRIEDAIPLINLAITTSGVNLSTKLSGTISPSRLLQASTFLTAADGNFVAAAGLNERVQQQVGPTWGLSLYMLFAGHANRAVDEAGIRETTWKEVIHKARVKLVRVPMEQVCELSTDGSQDARLVDRMEGDSWGSEFAYQLVFIEDLDDDRVHTFEHDEQMPTSFEDVPNAGIRDVVPIHEISKVFYADTGKILNINGNDDDGTNNPVLLIKRDVHAEPPRRMLHRFQMSSHGLAHGSELELRSHEDLDLSEIDAQIHRESLATSSKERPGCLDKTRSWRLPADLDPEWLAFEVYTEAPDSDNEADDQPVPSHGSKDRAGSLGPELTNGFSNMKLKSASPAPDRYSTIDRYQAPRIKTSLSLLEMLIKLTALQQFRQESHLAIEDEMLNFFLEDSATAGAGRDKEIRRRVRNDAVRRVGFDPYDESPIKRRGEEYIAHARSRVDGHGTSEGHDGYGLRDFERFSSSPMASPLVRPSIEQTCSTCGSPSPRPAGSQGMPLKLSTPPELRPPVLPKAASQRSLLATPTSTTKNRQGYLRAQSEPKPNSPLSNQVLGQQSDDDDAASM